MRKITTIAAKDIYPENHITTKNDCIPFARALLRYTRDYESATITKTFALWHEENGTYSIAKTNQEPWHWEKEISEEVLIDLVWKHRKHLWLPSEMEITLSN